MQAYSRFLLLRPVETKVVTAAILAVGGDALAQLGEREPYNTRRAASFVLFNACYRGGFQHNAFPLIASTFKGHALHGLLPCIPLNVCAAISCTAANQLVVVPLVYYPLFFAMTGALQGLDLASSMRRAREKFLPLMKRSLSFWIPVQYVQFAYVAAEWQVPYVCVWGLIWNVIVSVVAGRAELRVPVGQEEPRLPAATAALPAAEMPQSVDGGVRPSMQAMRLRQKDFTCDDPLAEERRIRLMAERVNGDAR
jgi:hypothetical protein